MDKQRILDELLDLLEANGVVIRREPLGGSGGGLCTIKADRIFFVDTQAGKADMAAICADAVSKIVDIDNIYIRPEVRKFIESYGKNNQ